MSEDINQEILKELRKTRRSNQVSTTVIGLILLLIVIFHPKPSGPEHSWANVEAAMKRMDYTEALSLAQANVALESNDYYGHQYLGYIYLAMGDVTNSEREYSRTYELFPNEENEKDLAAVRKRMAAEASETITTNSPAGFKLSHYQSSP